MSLSRKAADAGDAQGMANLGFMYMTGRGGLPKDDVQGVNWSHKAADAGSATGMNNLGFLYMTGRGGLPKDDAQAAKLVPQSDRSGCRGRHEQFGFHVRVWPGRLAAG